MKIDLHGKTHPEGLELIEEYMLLNSVKGSVSLHVITGNSPVMQKKIIDQIDQQVSPDQKNKIYSGVLSSLGDGYRVDDSLLIQMINYHRSKGINGEVFFYYETFNR